MVINSSGSRIVGDSNETYKNQDLVLLGPYLFHKWDDSLSAHAGMDCRVITIQFDMHLFDNQLLNKHPFEMIRQMLVRSRRGIQYSGKTLSTAKILIKEIAQCSGFEAVLKFLSLLDLLSRSTNSRSLASEGFDWQSVPTNSKRLHAAYQFIIKHCADPDLKMHQVASHVNLSDSAFSHFFKKSTNKSFTSFLIGMRLGNACRLLQESDDLIKDVANNCGFNNIANFNRLFKKSHKCTPLQYRELYQEKTLFDWSAQNTPGQFLPSDQPVPMGYHPDEYATRLVRS